MAHNQDTPEQYINGLPEERQEVIKKLRNIILKNLPKGFTEEMSYGMIGYVVPKSLYPEGYHANPDLPLPFINLASQKGHIALYHMGLVADKNLLEWFLKEYAVYSNRKPDMGKSCIRFKNLKTIPYELIGQLVAKITPEQWISTYRKQLSR